MERRHDAVARGGVKPGRFWAEPFRTLNLEGRQARGGAGLWAEPDRISKMCCYSRTTRLCAVQAAGTAEAQIADSGHRHDSRGR